MKSFLDRKKHGGPDPKLASDMAKDLQAINVFALRNHANTLLEMSKDKEKYGTLEVQDQDALHKLCVQAAYCQGKVDAARGKDSETACGTCGEKKAVRPTSDEETALYWTLSSLDEKLQKNARDAREAH